MSALQKPIYRFGEFELDPDERRLLAHGAPITLTPKVFDTLVLLVERAGHAISKDELMRALWPRGFVDESNLTKHIWLIRKALGEGEHDPRWIETVPKLGYRFVAPVQCVARSAADVDFASAESKAPTRAAPFLAPEVGDALKAEFVENASITQHDAQQASAAPTASLEVRVRRWILASAVALIVAFAMIAFFTRERAEDVSTAPGVRGKAIAIVEFNNFSQNAKDAWLGPALGEMLATEISAGGSLYVLPDELVRTARADLAAPLAGGYAAQSLSTLRRRLGADYVLSGGYLVAGAAEQPRVRLDLALQDARTGTAVATLARDAAVSDLPTLVAQAGVGLREHLGIAGGSSGELQLVANAQPPTADIARRIGFALDALHRNDPARARDELLDAVAEAPGYAPAYSYLAQAWSALGYTAKAAAAAEQAAVHAEGLPEEQRLQIELQQHATHHAWDEAAGAALELVALRPNNPDYCLRLIQLFLSAHKNGDAQTALDKLRTLPDAANDPRVELAAADVSAARSDAKSAAAHAREALKLAHARDVPGQIADAQARLGTALMYLGEDAEAQQLLQQAIAIYQRNGNPHGEASVRESLGKSLANSKHVDTAREEYQRAMAIYQSVGDLGGMSGAYTDLSRVLWYAGDRDGAQTAARHVLELSRETGDLAMQKWGLSALATADSDESAGDDVVKEYQEAIALDEKMGNPGSDAFTLANYADLLRLRGDLDQADAVCKGGIESAREVSDPQYLTEITLNCAEVALDRGDVAAAGAGFAQAMAAAKGANDAIFQPNIEMTIAQMDMGLHRWAEARTRLESAAEGLTKMEANTGAADAEALLAVTADALGDAAARDRAAARAKDLRRGINARLEVFGVDLALTVLRARAGDTAAISDMRSLADDAERRHWLGWALESRLAAVEALRQRHDPAAETLAAEVAASARAHGFGWVLARLDAQPAAAVTTSH